uniref:Gag-Pol polyprotein n=1 Tax=Tanacetum cinerariifolium TaxID=118510 RepID=A0A6L2K093_TANCI|nr:hypothetical protein [Tanacetum cinerariifolium]
MQTQTSNTLHNAIMEVGSKDRPPMLAPGNYVQWKSRIKRYIDTKPNHDLIHYCLENPPYKLDWQDIEVPVSEGSPITTTERIRETYKNVSSQQAATQNRGKATVSSPQPIYNQEPSMVDEDDETSKDKEIDKLMALISLSFKKIYKPTNNNLRTSSNTSHANQDNSPRINISAGYVARECQKPKREKDAAYHMEKMLLCKQEEVGIQLNAEQADWRDNTDDDELEDQELEAHYMYMAQLQEVSLNAADSGPIFDDEPLQKVSTDDHYNVFPWKVEEIDQNDDDNDLTKERELLASLIEKLKCEIDESKNRNKFLETSNKALIEKLKGEIEDFKNKNKSLESSNNFFKEANNKLSETNNLLYADYKKSEAELVRRNSTEYVSQMELECAKVRGDLLSYKMDYHKSCTKYTDTINALNQTILEIKNKLSAHQETISILLKQKEA